ncbi:hypothetical protein [Xenorhabdus hominickii]|uniref:Uncharacterized protein n=1 Tax=Xenorhabdus hominickii TaxID=351679 RepID=A0A2G0Q2W8_XENHO|nr:hypothetical protein [Xenorhabdus hominickii]AOM39785.1 hypothetical protein A9255_03850 [Xenorhabdus hominickii]PHM53562.1 hypothetical protein Xhom_03561 [Xenorhabdus hominickii]
MGDDTEENIEKLLQWGYGEIEEHEALMRDAVRISQQRWQENLSDEEKNKQFSFLKNSNRKESLTIALAPLKDQIKDDTIHQINELGSKVDYSQAISEDKATALDKLYAMARKVNSTLTAFFLVKSLPESEENNENT